jgi:preprotein translocase SecE subunit
MGGAGSVAAAPPSAGAQPRPAEVPAAEPERVRRGPLAATRRFIGESASELKKVEWPTQSQLVTGTVVVLVACIITGFYLYLNDRLWSYVVQHIFL